MHFKSTVAAALLGGVSFAQEAGPAKSDLPQFTPSSVKGEFVEQFTSGWEDRWKISSAKKIVEGHEDEEWAYVGKWAVEEPNQLVGMEGYKGLVLKNDAAHHAISAKFPKKIDNKGKTLVVQYEVKLQRGLECGGAYMKLLRENSALHQEEFANTTPYVIMFGPDKCGFTNKVHFIFNHKNPKTGKYEEKHMASPPAAIISKATELYTLVVRPDNTFEVRHNGESVKKGSLLEDMEPSVNPPKEIDDADDVKPADWVEEARIADPKATKPADWDEDAPREIIDEAATMPSDWLVDEPKLIPDPKSEKPEDWDDEEDGDFIPDTIPNPKCLQVSGCGPWTKPKIANPAYKGKWTAPLIDNPAYKGLWAPRKIANPDYYEDANPAAFEPMGAIGFEIWTMQSDIMFSNIYIGHDEAEAEKLAKESFFPKHAAEKKIMEAQKPAKDPSSPDDLNFWEDPVFYIKERISLFAAIFDKDPMEAIRFVPDVPAGFLALALTVIGFFMALFSIGSSGSAPAKKTEKKDDKSADAKTETSASATGTDAAKGATKRTTRST